MAPLRRAISFALLGLGAARLQVWKPAVEGVNELESVEKALQMVSGKGMDAQQKKAADSVVKDVERVVANLKSETNLTKAEKQAQVKGAIGKLQSLQSLWELSEVETSLGELVKAVHLDPEMQAAAKQVVASVDSVAADIEAGKVQGEAQRTKVAGAIQQLLGLEKQLSTVRVAKVLSSNATTSKVAVLARELAEKEADLKVAELQKKLLEKEMQLKRLEVERKDILAEQEAAQKGAVQGVAAQKEELADKAQVAKLVEVAKALAASSASSTKVSNPAPPAGAASSPQLPPQMEAILSDLGARATKVAASLKFMENQEAKSQAELKSSMSHPRRGSAEAVLHEQEVQQSMSNRGRRMYLKARVVKLAELSELNDGIEKIKKGDVGGLSSLLHKMQVETKDMEARTKNFWH